MCNNITTWKYNARNLPLKRIDPLGITQKGGKNVYDPRKTESYTYYGDGSKKTMVDRNGVTTSYAYDVLGNETKKEAAGLTITNKYDPAGNKVIMGDSSGKTTRAYDELNRCIIKNVPKVGSSTFEYSTIVDEGGVKYLAELFTDPTGKTTKTLLDKAGRPTLVIDPDNNKTKIEYYENGLKWKITQPGGATEVYTYFKDGTLKELKNTYGGKTDTYTYTYDAAGNQLTKTEPQGSTTYTYDRLNRLVKVVEPTPEGQRTTEYAYDKAGNRIRQVVQTGSSAIMATSYEYNEQNRLVSTTEETLGAGGVKAVETPGSKRAFIEYIYDNNGNLLYQKKAELTKLDPIAPAPKAHFSAFVMGQTTVEENPMVAWIGSNKYNAFNELIQSTQGGKAVSNGYNGEGLRVSKTVMGQTTNTLYVSDNSVLETDNSGKETGRTTYGAGIALSRKAGSETLSYLYNGHADVVALITSGGTAQATYTYDAFGVPLSSTGTAKNPIRYGGYEFDEETGYYYLKARFYDPKTARFLQEDTYRGNPTDPLSLNLYSYCSNNPVVYWDPTGHWKQGDEKLSQSSRVSISRLTDAYYSARTDSERNSISAAADRIRSNDSGNSSRSSGGTTGAKYNSTLSSSGRDYITASEWRSISTTKNDPIVRDVTRDGKITQGELNRLSSKSTTNIAAINTVSTQNIINRSNAVLVTNEKIKERATIALSANASSATMKLSYAELRDMNLGSGWNPSKLETDLIAELVLDASGDAYAVITGKTVTGEKQNRLLSLGFFMIPMVDKAGKIAVKTVPEIVESAAKTAPEVIETVGKPKGWRVGEPIDNLTKAGKEPSWSAVKSRFWKNEAANFSELYSKENVSLMQKGRAPLHDDFNVPMELHHKEGRSIPNANNINNLERVWPWQHADVDKYRYYNGPRP